ncbi:MAG: protein kinase [Candidatus Marinimicrobia bacterium]|nr:protein kinase [Candidatus Neomarinimicrobiota bacterium]
MIGKSISHYRIIEKLGEGGMGVVYKAEDTKLKRFVALKFLPLQSLSNEEERTRLVHEAQAAASLDHPNICTVHEIDEVDGNTFIAMAYIDGQSLKGKIDSGPLKIEESLNIAIQIAEGLQEAHEKGIVHRDIKSSNIMFSSKGQTKITDFGLVKLSGRTKLTKTGTTMGTVAYMSPEQTQGATVDHRADIWSFGVMLYEMITGQLPFKGDYDQAVVYSIVNEEPEQITGVCTGVPIELERIINKAMAKNPEERYQHVDEILVDLRSVAKEALIKIKPEESVPVVEVYEKEESFQFTKRKKRNKKMALLIAAVTAIALVASIIFIIQKQRSKFIANRIVVVPFENKTGDESLDMLGQMAAEMITQEMSQISELEAVPFISVMDSYSKKKEKPSAYTVAAQNEAGVLITGSYYLQGEDLFFRASIMEAEHKKLLESPSPVKGSSKTQDVVLERLCSQILGALAIYFYYDVQTGQAYIPSFEAYKEFQIGMELFGIDYDKARSHFYKSVEMDSAFTLPLRYIAVSYSNQGQNARADSLYDLINKHREKLAQFDRIMLDWGIADNSGNLAKAMRFLRKAEELAPRNYVIKLIIGGNAICQNLPQLTVDTYAEFGYERMAEEIRGEWCLGVLTEALYMLGEYEEALDVIHFSRQHFPDQSSNLRYEAILQAARGQIQDVYRVIDESFRLSGSAPGSVMRDAAMALRAHGHKDVAYEVLKRSLTWYKSRISGDHRYSIARVLYCNEQWAEVQQYFEQLYREYPNNQNYQGYTGIVAARLGDREKANRILEELHSKDESYLFGSHLYWCARIAAVLGEQKRAVDLLREAYGQGWGYGMYELLEMDFESLHNYKPYIELMRPKG